MNILLIIYCGFHPLNWLIYIPVFSKMIIMKAINMDIKCPKCNSKTVKQGLYKKSQKYRCKSSSCRHIFSRSSDKSYKHLRTPIKIIKKILFMQDVGGCSFERLSEKYGYKEETIRKWHKRSIAEPEIYCTPTIITKATGLKLTKFQEEVKSCFEKSNGSISSNKLNNLIDKYHPNIPVASRRKIIEEVTDWLYNLKNITDDYRLTSYNDDIEITDNTEEEERVIYKNSRPMQLEEFKDYLLTHCLLYTSPSPRDRTRSRMPSSA